MAIYSKTNLILNPDGSLYHINLRPEHLTDTIICVGDPTRVHRVSQHFDQVEYEMNRREFISHVGRIGKQKVMVISTGIGTDNVELVMNELHALASIDLNTREPKKRRRRPKFVRIGTAGALQPSLNLGDVVLAKYATGLDTLMNFYHYPQSQEEAKLSDKVAEYLQLPFSPYSGTCSPALEDLFAPSTVAGNCVTLPGFYAPQGRTLGASIRYPDLPERLMQFHFDGFWYTHFEMETSAYYALAKIFDYDMVSLSAIVANRATDKMSKDPVRIVDKVIRQVLDELFG